MYKVIRNNEIEIVGIREELDAIGIAEALIEEDCEACRDHTPEPDFLRLEHKADRAKEQIAERRYAEFFLNTYKIEEY